MGARYHRFCSNRPRNALPNGKTRGATITRNPSETQITVQPDLDGTGQAHITTGIGFLDHMLAAFARHALVDLTIDATGDPHTDRPVHAVVIRQHRFGAVTATRPRGTYAHNQG